MNYLMEDIKRYSRYFSFDKWRDYLSFFYFIIFNECIWFIVSYRFGRWVRFKVKIPIIKTFLKVISFIIHKIVSLICGISIPFEVNIGKGLYIGHSGGIVINAEAKIGDYCNLSPGVVIGQGGRVGNKGVPSIGNYVYIAPGAKIFGKILVGDYVAIGANSTVNEDVPDNCVVAGVPSKIVNYKGSYDFIKELYDIHSKK